MSKDSRSALNPFTGKKHYDTVNDDKFLNECYREYYNIINQNQVIDNTYDGQTVTKVASRLINTVEEYLAKIGRLDYVEDYYDWEFHLLNNETVNALCIPGGKIVVFSGILSIANSEEKLAFILGHEMAHALLDHSRTQVSAQNTKNGLATAGWLGSFALDLVGLGEIGSLTRAAVNVANIGSEFFLMNPWGRDQELEADKLGMVIIYLAGYDISGIPAFWQSMSNSNPNNHDFFSTHPADNKRIAVMNELIVEIANDKNFYSKPILSTTPTPKTEYKKISNKTCNSCGARVDSDSIFCSQCGHKFSVEYTCQKCGFVYGIGDKFCSNCGNKL